ncbi:MAG TPA: hypothetical protein VFQ91_00715 [Bryobacteraceae bacterium]|nr:hypothetical protein [Bryobacteraceae bacterium]
MTRKTKDPNATLDFVVDWTAWLDGDMISAVTWMVPVGITKTTQNNTDSTATVWLSGGSAKAVYPITCRVSTTAGRIEDFTFEILCAEK